MQYVGPFNSGSTIQLSGYNIKHIGIQMPNRTPFPFVFDLSDTNTVINKINPQIIGISFNGNPQQKYRISPNGILEFSDLAKINSLKMSFLENASAHTIIDVLIEK